MDNSAWLFLAAFVTAMLTLAGVIYSTRSSTPPLQVKALVDALAGLDGRVKSLEKEVVDTRLELEKCYADMKLKVGEYEATLDKLYSRLGRAGEGSE